MRRVLSTLSLTGVIIGLVATGWATSASQSAVAPTAETTSGPTSQADVQQRGFGSMQVVCRPSHAKPDDPIVYPRQSGAAHLHEFFANRSTNAYSTDASLAGKPTTCSRPGDTAAYWVPALLNDGRRVVPDRLIAYYRTRRHADITKVRPFPPGLKVIAGSALATGAKPQNTQFVNWHCGDGVTGTAGVPSRCGDQPLTLRIEFPNCWDGRRLDSADHKSHMAYGGINGLRGCPGTHPVPVPSLELNFRWKISGALDGVRLSSGGVHSGHADFWNAWKQPVLAQLVKDCLNAGRVCTSSISDAPLATQG